MEADLQAHVAFFLTGRRAGESLDPVDGLGLRPALFSGYRDLTKLRYDFPVVLLQDGGVQSLSGVVDGILDQVARGDDGERIRKHVLGLEQAIRTQVAAGASGLLSALWDQAKGKLGSADGLVADSLTRARAGLKTDGEVLDCDQGMPARLLRHIWSTVQQNRSRQFGANIARLVLKLSDILKADFVNSDAGRSAASLSEGVSAGFANAFDFEAMSRIITSSIPRKALPERRRARIQDLISVLQSQRFFRNPEHAGTGGTPYEFVFDSCGKALEAYRERLPNAVDLARTIAVAELEIKGEYNESRHDPLFDAFGENGLDPADLALFPGYLVRVRAETMQAAENDKLLEILRTGLPMKILVQIDDILEESPVASGHLGFGLRSRQLASVAISMTDVFVLQSASSNLIRYRDRLRRGLDYPGPALYSIYTGSAAGAGGIPPYLAAAAAMESRAFPALTYDPSAGADWASRFCIDDNPQSASDWPRQAFVYEDEQHQRIADNIPFTLIDFAACDPRHARHFARVPREKWNGSLIPVSESLDRETRGLPDKVPCLLMVDGNDVLQKVIVDDRLLREARRCRQMWQSLQELGGINNSHARTLVAKERKAWEESLQQEAATRPASATVAATASPAVPAAPAVAPAVQAAAEPEPERSRDEAYIETPRCSTCNECTTLNSRMFAYDANQQAYIADINAGTYAHLVEAAESCQVAIIHPGKPRNPNEPGLEELLKRAEPFL